MELQHLLQEKIGKDPASIDKKISTPIRLKIRRARNEARNILKKLRILSTFITKIKDI
jgi:hypothetical protein